MKVMGADDNPELVRRLATGLIAQWSAIPADIQAAILKDATLSIDPGSPAQTSLEQTIRQFIKSQQASLLRRA
jgi:hypothetical protein